MKFNKDIVNSKFYILANIISLIFYAFLYSIITFLIESEIYGKFIYTYSIFLIIGSLCSFGLQWGYRRNFFEYKKSTDLNNFLSTTLLYLLLASIIILIIYFYINYFFFKIENIYFFLLSSILIDNLIQCVFIHFENQKKAKTLFWYNNLKNLLYFLVAFILLFFNQEERSLIYALFISKVIILLLICFKDINFYNSKIQLHFFYNLIKISYPSIPRILFGQINASVDKIMIGNLLNYSLAGIYSIGQSIAFSAYQIATSLDKVFVPKMYKYLFKKENNKIGPYLTPFIYTIGGVTIIVILCSNFFVTFFLDNKYIFSKYIILIFSISYFALSFSKISGHQLLYKKKTWLSTNIFMLNLLLNIILNFPLIYFFGIIGAAIATLIANIISIIISIRFANMFAFFLYETKKIFIICSFVVISFVMAVLSNFISSNINYELLFNFILFFLIAGSYIFYGFYSKILTSSSLKLIFRIHDMK